MTAYNNCFGQYDTLCKIGKIPHFYSPDELKKIPRRLGSISYKERISDTGSNFNSKHKYYTFLLYPDNKNHMWLLEYLKNNRFQGFIAIKHKGDKKDNDLLLSSGFDVDGKSTIKDHYHCMISYHYSKPYHSAISQLEHYGIFYCQPVTSVNDLIIYFLHQTPDCVALGKEQYTFDDLLYSGSFVQTVDKLRILQESCNRINAGSILLEYSQVCSSPLEFYSFALSQPLLDDYLRKHQLIFEKILQRRFEVAERKN